ncbi:hypothetical protein ACKWTF_001288 [Chironomus riparius]
MKCKSIACLIILLNIAGVIVLASSAYDSIECDPHSNRARTGRARLIESIPCDLNKQSYCNLPGESYPWNAVKKFVYDNQGLVRRMYGDVRHIFVMQSELENEIDFDDIKLTADKYSKAFNTHNKPRHRQMKAKKVTAKATTTTRKNYRSGDTSEPHFRPAQRPAAINTKQRTKPSKLTVQSNEQSEKTSLIDNLILTNVESLTNTKLNEKSTSQTTTKLTSITSSSTTTPSLSTSEIMNDEDSNRIVDNHEQQAYDDDESDREKNETVDIAVIDLFSNISSALSASSTSTVSTTEKVLTESTTMSSSTTSSTSISSEKPLIMTKNKVTTEENEELEEVVDDILSELVNDSSSSASSTSAVFDKIDDKGQASKDPSLTSTTEAQLYQDAIPTANRRGVNACPVKEEVVAPFWGNNTRGEILALLNVYPFEQYINWEKCTNENEQMYCRKGCRCEQQYRLHRLLAYNPLDACRGIFSDWFRFPSCCICKCYDIPFDYRVTSRSPRGSDRVLDAAISDNEDVENDDDDGFDNDDKDSDGNYYFDDDYENE